MYFQQVPDPLSLIWSVNIFICKTLNFCDKHLNLVCNVPTVVFIQMPYIFICRQSLFVLLLFLVLPVIDIFCFLQFERDIMIWNHMKYLDKPIFTKADQTIAQHRRWFKQFYSEHSPRFSGATESLDWWRIIVSTEQNDSFILVILIKLYRWWKE